MAHIIHDIIDIHDKPTIYAKTHLHSKHWQNIQTKRKHISNIAVRIINYLW